MIKSIELQNFQPHHNTKIDLHESINVIQGLSDSGKSALLRGIDAVFRKAPFYLTFDKDSGKNTITFDNGDVISRSFTKTKTQKCPNCKEKVKPEDQICEACGEFLSVNSSDEFYMLNDERRDRFGKKLPDFITDFTKIKPIQFLDNEIFLNFAEQHEPMFFVSDLYTGSLRNKMISTLIPDSEKIDVLIKELVSEKISTSAQLKVYNKQLLMAEEQLNIINSDVNELTDAFKMIQRLAHDICDGETNLNALEGLEIELNRVLPIVKLKPIIEKFDNKLNQAYKTIQQYQDNETTTQTLNNLDKSLQNLSKYDSIDMMEFALFGSLSDDIDDIYKVNTQLANLNVYSQQLKNIKNIDIPKLPDIDFPTNHALVIDTLENLEYSYKTNLERSKQCSEQKNILKKELQKLQSELESDKMICPITNKKYCESCIEILKNDFKS